MNYVLYDFNCIKQRSAVRCFISFIKKSHFEIVIKLQQMDTTARFNYNFLIKGTATDYKRIQHVLITHHNIIILKK